MVATVPRTSEKNLLVPWPESFNCHHLIAVWSLSVQILPALPTEQALALVASCRSPRIVVMSTSDRIPNLMSHKAFDHIKYTCVCVCAATAAAVHASSIPQCCEAQTTEAQRNFRVPNRSGGHSPQILLRSNIFAGTLMYTSYKSLVMEKNISQIDPRSNKAHVVSCL